MGISFIGKILMILENAFNSFHFIGLFSVVIIKPVKFLKNLPPFSETNFQLKGTAIKLGLKWRCRCQWLCSFKGL